MSESRIVLVCFVTSLVLVSAVGAVALYFTCFA